MTEDNDWLRCTKTESTSGFGESHEVCTEKH